MLKTIGLILAFCSLTFGTAKNAADSYKISYPKYIPAYSQFDVSLITSDNFPDAQKLEIYVIPDSKVTFNKIELRSLYKNSNLSFVPVNLPGVEGQAYKTSIPLTETEITPGSFFQILFGFKSDVFSSSVIRITGVYKNGDKIIGRINSISGKNEDGYITAKINFYKPQKNAGYSLNFLHSSRMNVSLRNAEVKNLLAEFWIKTTGNQAKFWELKSKIRSDFSYSLSINAFQMLMVKKSGELISNAGSYFISNKNWYHIAADISLTQNYIEFYCNGTFIGKTNIPPFTDPNDLVFIFGDQQGNNSFQIDLLRFVNLGNTIDASFSNRNFLSFISDSSHVIYQLSFDKTDQLNTDNDRIKITSVNTQYLRSDAPIFARAPELNISLLNEAYNLKWSGGDYKQAQYYVLQKMINNSEYRDVCRITAENISEPEYSFVDSQDPSSDVVYYRIKQVNSDGSIVYSSQVKVGQGAQRPFIIRQNYPNPFNPKTSIVVDLLTDTQVNITVYSLEGKEIAKIYNGYLGQGLHTFSFDGTNLPSGVYLYKITTPEYSETKKMILTK